MALAYSGCISTPVAGCVTSEGEAGNGTCELVCP